ncbi:Helix-turn-helix [Collimonas sp. OK307]|nr:Helix-turn-helix [Collimonas sp. OK307]
MCGFDRTYISGIERGVRNPSLSAIEALAMALSVTVAELFSGL